jgi:hypothetical protein
VKRAAILIALLMCGCGDKEPKKSDFQVDALFTKDGCTVYRFRGELQGEGHYGYFTNCNGSAEWSYQCGKGHQCPAQTAGNSRSSTKIPDDRATHPTDARDGGA